MEINGKEMRRGGALYKYPKNLGGEKEKMNTRYRHIVILIAVLALLIALSMPVMALYDYDGFDITTASSGTMVNGEVYVGGGHGVEGTSYVPNTYYQNFTIPYGNVTFARLYVGVWGGTENYDGYLETIFNGVTYPTLHLEGKDDTNPNVWCAGHGVHWVYYDVTSNTFPGFNKATANTWQGHSAFDGRMYGIVLVAAVENASMPSVTYWINDGHVNLNKNTPQDETTTGFAGPVTATNMSASLTTVQLAGGGTYPPIDEPYYNSLNFNGELLIYDAADGCGEDEWGKSWCDSFDIDEWCVGCRLNSSSNNVTFDRGTDPYLHPVIAVLQVREWYFKEPYQNPYRDNAPEGTPPSGNYAPSGMPDFDQKQDNWKHPITGQETFCGPTAIANCFWWFDSKFGNHSGWPGDGKDEFPLVTAYTDNLSYPLPPFPLQPYPLPLWINDDHRFDNVDHPATVWCTAPCPANPAVGTWDGELVERLACCMNTDGKSEGGAHKGTNVFKMQECIDEWLNDTGLAYMFYERTIERPSFWKIEEEVKKSEDVILLLGFWEEQYDEKYLHSEIDPRVPINPIGIAWHELYPQFCNWSECTSWNDTDGDSRLSPGDYVDFDGNPEEWYVRNVTITINVTNGTHWKYLEFTGGFNQINQAMTNPNGTWWHEIHPEFCPTVQIVNWTDNGDGNLSFCDNITFKGDQGIWHVEEVGTDIIIEKGTKGWTRIGGHYVTVAGVNSYDQAIAFSDPYFDNAEVGGPGVVPVPHPPYPHDALMHNDAQYVSHDFYNVSDNSPSPGGDWWLPDYPVSTDPTLVYNFEELNWYGAPWLGGPIQTEIEYAVIISPKPNLTIRDNWIDWPNPCRIGYRLENTGYSPACCKTQHHVNLSLSTGNWTQLVPICLPPRKGSYVGFFNIGAGNLSCQAGVRTCADCFDVVDETNENDNCYTENWMCGDVLKDGAVTPWDVAILNSYFAGMGGLGQIEAKWTGDVLPDGYITPWDVAVLNTKVAGLGGISCMCTQTCPY